MFLAYWNGWKMLEFDESKMLEIRRKILYMLIKSDVMKVDVDLVGYNKGKTVCISNLE